MRVHLIIIGIFFWSYGAAQSEYQDSPISHFFIENSNDFDKVKLSLTANSGICHIQPARNENIVNLISNNEKNLQETNINTHINQRIQYINFNFKNKKKESIGKVLSSKLFNSFDKDNEKWKIYLSRQKPLDLELKYTVGNATVDLSGLPVEKLKINTGNADVDIGYYSDVYNPVEMDTFYVEVDFGSLSVSHINYSNARSIIADVGFGSLKLDFSDPCKKISKVKATVGAGKLEVIIPRHDVPMIIQLNDSPLCHVNLPDTFIKKDKKTFVNQAYQDNPDREALSFDVEVAMGNIDFHP